MIFYGMRIVLPNSAHGSKDKSVRSIKPPAGIRNTDTFWNINFIQLSSRATPHNDNGLEM